MTSWLIKEVIISSERHGVSCWENLQAAVCLDVALQLDPRVFGCTFLELVCVLGK